MFTIDDLGDDTFITEDDASQLVTSLAGQISIRDFLEQLGLDITSTNYKVDQFTKVEEIFNLLFIKYNDDFETLRKIRNLHNEIMEKFITRINTDWDFGIERALLTPTNYKELYNFFFIKKKSLISSFLFDYIVANKQHFVQHLKKILSKRDQTISAARKMFNTMEDTYIWVGIQDIIKNVEEYEINYSSFIDYLGILEDDTSILTQISYTYDSEDFFFKYSKPIIEDMNEFFTLSGMVMDKWEREFGIKIDDATVSNEE